MSRQHFTCRVPGCLSWYLEPGKHLSEHEHTPHVRCGCGWVGVSWMRHKAQRLQRGFDMSRCTPHGGKPVPVDAFLPDWTVHPGELVKEELEAQGLLQNGHTRVAARLLHLTPEALADLLACQPEARITSEVARGLATFSASARFWLRLQSMYDDGVRRGLVSLPHA